jgi:UDP-glucose 4-epimerase
MTKKVLVTGGAGFIGSNLARQLIAEGNKVVIIDNFNTGNVRNLSGLDIEVLSFDLVDIPVNQLTNLLLGVSSIYHLAANADVRDGWKHRRLDFDQNLKATINLLEASADAGVSEFIFTSTGSVYGEAQQFPTTEGSQIPIQTSLYGASKFAAEGFIQAYASAGKLKATVFRLVSALGPNYSHGHVIDFVRQLKSDSSNLTILGDGTQRKSYMHVHDCVRALISLRSKKIFDVFNIGRNEYCSVLDSVGWICEELGVKPKLSFTGGEKGWIGDNPFIWLDVSKARSHGWEAEYSIEDSIRLTVRW